MKRKLEDIIEEQRELALSKVDEQMLQAFVEIGEWVCNEALEYDLKRESICGYTQNTLRLIGEHYAAGDLETWTFGERYYRNLVDFMGLNKIRFSDFRKRYPNAFSKWSEKEEQILMEAYAAGASLSSISARMGRNVNALRLRLEHLGVSVPSDRLSDNPR